MLRCCDCSDRLKENDDFRDPFCTSFVKQRLALKYGESNILLRRAKPILATLPAGSIVAIASQVKLGTCKKFEEALMIVNELIADVRQLQIALLSHVDSGI